MQAAYKQGTALKSDITRYELQLQNLELSLTNTNNRIDIINYKLSTTIGMWGTFECFSNTRMMTAFRFME